MADKKEKAEKPKKEAAPKAEAKKPKAEAGGEAKAEKHAKGDKHTEEKHGEKHDKKEEKAHHRAHHATSKSREDARCKMKGCKRTYRAKGYCQPHYREWRHGKFGVARYKTCKENNCTKATAMNRFGFCEEHYTNYYVKGVEKAKAAPAEAKPAAKAEEKAAASA